MDKGPYVTQREAAKLLGCSPLVIRKRTRELGLPIYRDDVDRRRILLRRADVVKLAERKEAVRP